MIVSQKWSLFDIIDKYRGQSQQFSQSLMSNSNILRKITCTVNSEKRICPAILAMTKTFFYDSLPVHLFYLSILSPLLKSWKFLVSVGRLLALHDLYAKLEKSDNWSIDYHGLSVVSCIGLGIAHKVQCL